MTDKQKLFIKEYLVDLNATAAYKRAGYTAKGNSAEVSAHQLLRNPKVAESIQKEMQKRANKAEITAQDVLNDILDTRDTVARAMANTADMKPSDMAALSNARKANNELLGKHLKLFTDKVEHSGEIEAKINIIPASKK